MTNAELIQAIKAEIERLAKRADRRTDKDHASHNAEMERYGEDYWNGYGDLAYALLSFLDSLKSEKPMQDGLDEDLINEADRIFYSYEIHEGYYLEPIIDCVSLEQFRGIARHFAQWGAEHLAGVRKMIEPEKMEREEELKKAVHQVSEEIVKEIFPDDLESGDFFTEIDLKNCITRVAYQFADWQKEKMLKEAVEGEVVKDISNKLAVTAKINLDGFKFGDKVRVIIVKED